MRNLIHKLLNLFADTSHVNNHPGVRKNLDHGRRQLAKYPEATTLKLFGMGALLAIIAAMTYQYDSKLGAFVGAMGALAMSVKHKRDSEKGSCYLYHKALLAQAEYADRLNKEERCAFLHGVQAGRSYLQQFKSNLPHTSAYKRSEAYYAGLEAARLNDLSLIKFVESKRITTF